MNKLTLPAISIAIAMSAVTHADAQWSLNGAKVFYNGGNVGIGTNNPAYTLEVRSVGARAISGYATPTTGTHYGVYGQADSTDGRAVYGLANSISGTNFAVVGKTNSSNGFAGYFVGGKNYFEGRVGIGGANPTQKLQVVGNIKATGWIGTDANAPVDLRSFNTRILRLQYAASAPIISANVIGGMDINSVAAGVVGATVGGGGARNGNILYPNAIGANGHYGTISGGLSNGISGDLCDTGTIGGGFNNSITNQNCTIAGGSGNMASGLNATVGGGFDNFAAGDFATAPGGRSNTASGTNSFAAGFRAVAAHAGSFVWGDNTNADVSSTAANQFVVRAAGGVWFGTNSSASIPAGRFINTSTGAYLTTGGTWTNASSRDLKENFTAIDSRDVLEKIAALPISKWNYKVEGDSVKHIGPMAQDFAAAFGVGGDDRSIATVDADGVALAAIQGLHKMMTQKDSEIAALRSENQQMQKRLSELEQIVHRLAAKP